MRGWRAGAKAANQASVLLGSLAPARQPSPRGSPDSDSVSDSDSAEPDGAQAVFSSAVPVFPATVTPGIAAEVPVPTRTTSIISRRTVRATEALIAGVPS